MEEPRRSGRVRIKPNNRRVSSLSAQTQAKTAHPSKKRKTDLQAPPKPKRRGKCLDVLLTMPLDVICEIASWMTPLELLRMSRASKGMRALFLSPASKPVWVAARKSDPFLPELPEDMSEPAYASLCFDDHCDVCLAKSNASRTMWNLRARLCRFCSSDMIPGTSGRQWKPDSTVEMILRRHEIALDDFWEMLPTQYAGCYSLYHRGSGYFRKSEVVRVLRQMLQTSGADREAYIDERKAYADRCMKLGSALEGWVEKKAKMVAAECQALFEAQQAILDDRRAAIHGKLLAIGWEQEDIPGLIPWPWESGVIPYDIRRVPGCADSIKAWCRLSDRWVALLNQGRQVTESDWPELLPKLEELIPVFQLLKSEYQAAKGNASSQ